MLTRFEAVVSWFYQTDADALEQVSDAEYRRLFIENRTEEQIKAAYSKAWEAKNFEIENYWKRANYFWAFQVASFAGYFAVLSSAAYASDPQVLYIVVCIGVITGFAWFLTNKGSKAWQRHWEIHVDMLEEKVTGPLYKIVTVTKTYSVSKLNEIVSVFFIGIWLVLGTKYFRDHLTFCWGHFSDLDMVVLLSTLISVLVLFAMFFGHGRGRFGRRKVRFYKRDFSTLD